MPDAPAPAPVSALQLPAAKTSPLATAVSAASFSEASHVASARCADGRSAGGSGRLGSISLILRRPDDVLAARTRPFVHAATAGLQSSAYCFHPGFSRRKNGFGGALPPASPRSASNSSHTCPGRR